MRRRGNVVGGRLVRQLRDSDPRHPFLADIDAKDRAFERAAGRYLVTSE